MSTTRHTTFFRRPRPSSSISTMHAAKTRAALLTAAEVGEIMASVQNCAGQLRTGTATEDHFVVFRTHMRLALAIERAGYMRGLLGHIEAAICACSAIHDRAMATGSWKPVPVTLAELDAITTMEDLHDMQLRQLTGGELATIVNKVIHEAQNEAVFMPPGDLQQAGAAA